MHPGRHQRWLWPYVGATADDVDRCCWRSFLRCFDVKRRRAQVGGRAGGGRSVALSVAGVELVVQVDESGECR